MAYLIDANVLIQAKNAHYGFTFCPAFWDWIVEANLQQKVYLTPKVFDEVNKGKDQLKNWCGVHPGLRLHPSSSLSTSLTAIAGWVVGQSYDQNAINTFLGVADYYLISHAHADSHTVVTHEVSGNLSTKRVKIPEPCNALGVPYMSPYKMLQAEGAKFIL